MTAKSMFITLYLLFGFVFTVFAWFFGYPASAHRGFAYTLGANLFTWPFSDNFYLFFRIVGSAVVLVVPLAFMALKGNAND